MPRSVLVTGGCGFIGSHCVRHWLRAHPQDRVFNLDLLTYAGNPQNLADVEGPDRQLAAAARRYHFIHGDICNTQLLDALFQEHRFELVVNFAAETHVDRSIISMTDFINTNIGGVRCLIEAVRTHRVPRFVHISTDEVYGSIPAGQAGEDAPLRPSNPYSSSKAAADLIVLSFIRTHRLPAIVIRGSNNYGTYQYPEKLIPLAISNLIEGRKIPVHGDGRHVRSWLHVQDFCEAIDCIAHRAPVHEVYNVAGEERTNLELLALIAAKLKQDLAQSKVHINDRPGADPRYAPDGSKLRDILGWAPARRLATHLPEVVDWYLEHRDWWSAIRQKREFQDHYERQSKGMWY